MTRFVLAVVAVAFCAALGYAADKDKPKEDKKVASPLDMKMTGIDGKEMDLSKLKGKVVLVVNVASKCGNTPQYTALQKMYADHEKDGLVILGVPANEFGKQEPGTNEEIAKFCTKEHGVTFPMTEKVVVKGDGISPLYKFLTEKETNPDHAGAITWNFEKFLINKKGEVVGRFSPRTKPDAKEVTDAIKKELEAK